MIKYLYEVQIDSEKPLYNCDNIKKVAEYLNKEIGLNIYNHDILSNYFRKRTKNKNKLCSSLKTLTRFRVGEGKNMKSPVAV
jgi:hypothetical protein